MPGHTHDVLIIGQGLAGAVLMHAMLQRGLRVHAFTDPEHIGASEVAAGLVNPISLRRMVPAWRAAETFILAEKTYRDIEERLNIRCWHRLSLTKIMPTAAEVLLWQKALEREDTRPFLTRPKDPELAANGVATGMDHGVIAPCAWLDMRLMLSAHRAWALQQGLITMRSIERPEPIGHGDGISIGDKKAGYVVHCTGTARQLPGLVPVKGEVLTIRIRGLRLTNALHKGIFLLPIGDDLYRVGSTYEWQDVWSGPSERARSYLLGRVEQLLPDHKVEVVEHLAGVRPASRDRRPLLGLSQANEVEFNGLGSRGVSLAPWCAQALIEHLFEGIPLDREVLLDRFS